MRICTASSRMVHWVEFNLSHDPPVNKDLFRPLITIVASLGMAFVFTDTLNTFQTNAISDPRNRFYVSLPALYLVCFGLQSSHYPMAKYKESKEIILQSLSNI